MKREERRKNRRSARGRSVPWFSLLVVGVVVVFAFLLLRSFGVFDEKVTGPDINPSQVQPNIGTKTTEMAGTHIGANESFSSYNTTPPSSGPHWNIAGRGPIQWGVYTTQQRNEGVVHNLEHGGILIAYNGISEEDVAKLRSIRSRWPRGPTGSVKIIIEPYPGLTDAKIALTAWGFIDKMDVFDERRILGFIGAHINQGPEPNGGP